MSIIKEDIRQCKEDAENAFGDEAYLQAVKSRENGVHYILCEIERQPVAELREVKHGYWKWNTVLNYCCSCCGVITEVDEVAGKPLYKFCPYCGATMEGDVNAEIC